MKRTRRIIIHTFILRLSLKVSTLKCISFPGFPSHPNIRRTWRSGQKVGFGMNVTSQERSMVKLSVERAVRFKLVVTCTALRSHALHLRTRKRRVAPTSTSPVPRKPQEFRLQAWHLHQIFKHLCAFSNPQVRASLSSNASFHCCTGCVPTASRRMSSGCLEIEHSLCSGSIIRFPAVTQAQ